MFEEFKRMFFTMDHKNIYPNSTKWLKIKAVVHRDYPQMVPSGVPFEQPGVYTGTLFHSVGTWKEKDTWFYGIHPMVMAGTRAPSIEPGGNPLAIYAPIVEWDLAVEKTYTINNQTIDMGSLVTFAGFKALSRFLEFSRIDIEKKVIRI